jgi:hypothetical protein
MWLLWAVDFEVRPVLPVLPEEVLAQGIGPLGSSTTRLLVQISGAVPILRGASRPAKAHPKQIANAPHRHLENVAACRGSRCPWDVKCQHTGDRRSHRDCRRITAVSNENRDQLTISILGFHDSALGLDSDHEDYSFSLA